MRYDFDRAVDRSGTNSIKWEEATDGRLAMGLADMDFATAPPITDALRRRVAHGVFGYTEPGPAFYAAIVDWIATRRGWRLDPGWLVPAPGVMQSLAYALRSALRPGAGVIVQTPAFAPIPAIVEANGFRVVENELRLIDNRYVMDEEGLDEAAALPGVDALVLCSPHNPSGRVWTREELDAVVALADAHDLLVISDEIHAETIFAGRTFVPYGVAAGPGRRHVTLFGPSKGFNLAGLRTSVVAMPDDGLRDAFTAELVGVNEDFGVGVMGAAALEAAYTRGGEWLDALTGYLAGNVDELTTRLADVRVDVMPPDASFLVWLNCRRLGLADDELQNCLIEEAGVVVEPGVAFGSAGSGFVRVNIGTTRSRVIEAAERIDRALRG